MDLSFRYTAGIPPKRALAMLPVPRATSSMLELCLELIIESETTQESSDSIAASTAMVKALGRRSLTTSKLTLGRVKS